MSTEGSQASFNVEGLRFSVGRPELVPLHMWDKIQHLARVAFGQGLPVRSEEEVDYFLQMDNPLAFRASRFDPQEAVRTGRLRGNQEFREPLVALVSEGSDLIGYSYTANNVSGRTPVGRRLKWAVSPGLPLPKFGGKNYAYTREIAVHPERQGRGIARIMDYLLHERRHPRQTSTRYVYTEMPEAISYSETIGFELPRDPVANKVAKPELIYPFGPDTEAAGMYRMTALVRTVLESIQKAPGAVEAIDYAKGIGPRLE